LTKKTLFIYVVLTACLFAENIILYNGTSISGKIFSIKDNEVTFKREKSMGDAKSPFEKKSLFNEVARLEIRPDKKSDQKKQPVTALLVNGDRLSGELIELNGSILVLKTLFGEVTLVAGTLQALFFGENLSQLPVDKNFTTIILNNGDELKCRLKEIKDNKVRVTSDLGELELTFDRINALVLVAAGSLDFRGKDFISVVELVNGDRYSGRYFSLTGLKFKLEPMWALKAKQAVYEFETASVANVTFKNSGAVFLSDLTPAKIEEKAYLDFHLPWKKDKNIRGEALRINSVEYKKGISCQAKTELTWLLAGDYSSFRGVCGIEDSAVTGEANLLITADGKTFFEGKLKKGGAVEVLDFDLKGVKELKLTAGFGEAGDAGALVALGNPVLVKVIEGKEEAVKVSEGVFLVGKVTIDKNNKELSFPARVETRTGLIEYLAVNTEGKGYESILISEARPVHLQVGLIILGLQYGQNLNMRNDPAEPKGSKVEIFLEVDGKRLEMKEVIYDRVRKSGLEGGEFVFTGSKFVSGSYLAEQEGSLISSFKDPGAVIVYNKPTPPDATSYSAYDANPVNLPAAAHPVTVVIKAK